MAPITLITLALFIFIGCVTPINWQARVGVYTFDQAVADYGPPMASATLSDRSTVCDWMTRSGSVVVNPGPYPYPYYGRGYGGPAYGGYTATTFPARFLRLTFAPDGKLKAWKEYSK
ncbi:MAG TPA: hypothetical protein VMH87_05400 [Pseudomonadales bacterium]|nr:hypothetical protein [Pseudomonadales bacterium]